MLTVVIPSYNHEEYIKDCICAVLKIEISDLKVLIVDDGSIDKTVDMIKEAISEAGTVPVELVQKPNSGLVSSLNLALTKVNTEYVYFCASDDIPISSGVEQCVALLDKQAGCKFMIGGAVGFSSEAEEFLVYGSEQERFFQTPPVERFNKLFFNYPSPLLLQSTVFRTQAIRDVGGWSTDLYLDDYSFFIKVLTEYPEHTTDFVFRDDILVVKYRQHSNNMFRHTFRLFSMVKEVVYALAPTAWQRRAVAKYAAKYGLSALRARRYRDFLSIIDSIDFRCKLLVPIYLAVHIYERNKIRK